ncbi:MAG: DUF3037 domain-containing protein [Bryobacteraceae bacterium]|nr:DUF3037 domain-containing protein [Bryobacteraceae bacterium]
MAPCVEREEFINAGVILHCAEQRFLQCRTHLDEERVRALWPEADLDLIRGRLLAVSSICAGDPAAGPIARLSKSERFHWLTAPRSTMMQVSPVHSGLCESPEQTLEDLYRRVVLMGAPETNARCTDLA